MENDTIIGVIMTEKEIPEVEVETPEQTELSDDQKAIIILRNFTESHRTVLREHQKLSTCIQSLAVGIGVYPAPEDESIKLTNPEVAFNALAQICPDIVGTKADHDNVRNALVYVKNKFFGEMEVN